MVQHLGGAELVSYHRGGSAINCVPPDKQLHISSPLALPCARGSCRGANLHFSQADGVGRAQDSTTSPQMGVKHEGKHEE
jgi:hypothetical protein